MQEIGVVDKVVNNGKSVKVVFPRRTECEKCGMCMRHKNEMTVSVTVKNTLGAEKGDRVAVGMKDGFVLKAVFIVYVIPIILVGLTLGLGRKLNELLLFGLVIVALAVGLVISVICDKSIRKRGTGQPQMTSIVSKFEKPVVVDREDVDEQNTSVEDNKD